ncbi:uncharacterized protein LOC141915165 [Tubulanus polymorphus]|uniref:uncharacterized protein LOC141915165 n=1 Tax=Tubulanus polymorphus TaxID=672921 RepID=UPI003DA43830
MEMVMTDTDKYRFSDIEPDTGETESNSDYSEYESSNRFRKRSLILGFIQVFCGIAVIVIDSIQHADVEMRFWYYHAFWLSVICFASATLSVLAGSRQQVCTCVTCMIACTLAALAGQTSAIFVIYHLLNAIRWFYSGEPALSLPHLHKFNDQHLTDIILLTSRLFVTLLHTTSSLFEASFCCRMVCCSVLKRRRRRKKTRRTKDGYLAASNHHEPTMTYM